MIKDVITQDLKQFVDERGRVMHMVRVDNPLFERFGEIYFSEILPGAVKAWKYHKKMTQLFAVPTGMIRLVVFDDRHNSMSKGMIQIHEIGSENYQLIKIPPSLWYGFKCISSTPALVANCTDFPHDPEESRNKRMEDHSVPYHWE